VAVPASRVSSRPCARTWTLSEAAAFQRCLHGVDQTGQSASSTRLYETARALDRFAIRLAARELRPGVLAQGDRLAGLECFKGQVCHFSLFECTQTT